MGTLNGHETQHLPPGTDIEMTQEPSGSWSGHLLDPDGVRVEADGAPGMTDLVARLTRHWQQARRVRIEGKPSL